MIVANDVSADTRVRKMAHDLAASGLRVSVLGVSKTARREDLSLGMATVTLLPVGDRLRTRRALASRLTNRHQIAHEISIRRARFYAYQRDVNAEIAWLRSDYFRDRANRNEEQNAKARERLHRRAQRERATDDARLIGRLRNGLTRSLDEYRKSSQKRREARMEARFRRSEDDLNRRLDRRHESYLRAEGTLKSRMIEATETGDSDNWQRALPELHDYEVAFGPALDALDVDVIHAQDVHLLGVAARAASRARARGLSTKLVYDAHEYIQGLAPPRPVKAWSSLESEYIGRADAVITVAPTIARMLQEDYDLAGLPTVVMNIPAVGATPARALRDVVGLGESDLLLVYSGGLDATRGVHTLVIALAQLPDAHLALVSKAETVYTNELDQIAREGGYSDRLHFAPFVEPQNVVGYLSSADVGVHTIVSGPINHEVTLPNKVFEYMHARLPIVISDCKAMSNLVESLGVGKAFVSEDPLSLAEVLEEVIEHRAEYRRIYADSDVLNMYSWTTQRARLLGVYSDLLGSSFSLEAIEGEALPSLAIVT